MILLIYWLSFPERLAPATGIGVALNTGLTGSRRPEYSLDKLNEKNYYTYKGDERVLKDDVSDEIRQYDKEIREIVNNKNIPESCM